MNTVGTTAVSVEIAFGVVDRTIVGFTLIVGFTSIVGSAGSGAVGTGAVRKSVVGIVSLGRNTLNTDEEIFELPNNSDITYV